MLKNKKIGMKIALGIAIMLGIISVVIGITIFNMMTVKNASNDMSNINLPNVHTSQQVNTLTSAMMLEMRGFVYTHDVKKIELVDQYAEELGSKLTEASQFAKDKKMSTEMQNVTDQALSTYNTYIQEKDAYKANHEQFMVIWNTLLTTVTEFYASVDGYEADQTNSLNTELANEATANNSIKNRVNKIVGINRITNYANLARVYANKALESRDPAYFDKALESFPKIYDEANKMLAVTSKAYNKDQLNATIAAAKKYESNLLSFKALMIEQQSMQIVLVDTGNKLLDLSNQVLVASLNQSISDAKSNQSAVNIANIFLIVGFLVALVLGTLINYQVIRGITGNIKKVTKAADLIAIGDTEFELNVD